MASDSPPKPQIPADDLVSMPWDFDPCKSIRNACIKSLLGSRKETDRRRDEWRAQRLERKASRDSFRKFRIPKKKKHPGYDLSETTERLMPYDSEDDIVIDSTGPSTSSAAPKNQKQKRRRILNNKTKRTKKNEEYEVTASILIDSRDLEYGSGYEEDSGRGEQELVAKSVLGNEEGHPDHVDSGPKSPAFDSVAPSKPLIPDVDLVSMPWDSDPSKRNSFLDSISSVTLKKIPDFNHTQRRAMVISSLNYSPPVERTVPGRSSNDTIFTESAYNSIEGGDQFDINGAEQNGSEARISDVCGDDSQTSSHDYFPDVSPDQQSNLGFNQSKTKWVARCPSNSPPPKEQGGILKRSSNDTVSTDEVEEKPISQVNHAVDDVEQKQFTEGNHDGQGEESQVIDCPIIFHSGPWKKRKTTFMSPDLAASRLEITATMASGDLKESLSKDSDAIVTGEESLQPLPTPTGECNNERDKELDHVEAGAGQKEPSKTGGDSGEDFDDAIVIDEDSSQSISTYSGECNIERVEDLDYTDDAAGQKDPSKTRGDSLGEDFERIDGMVFFPSGTWKKRKTTFMSPELAASLPKVTSTTASGDLKESLNEESDVIVIDEESSGPVAPPADESGSERLDEQGVFFHSGPYRKRRLTFTSRETITATNNHPAAKEDDNLNEPSPDVMPVTNPGRLSEIVMDEENIRLLNEHLKSVRPAYNGER